MRRAGCEATLTSPDRNIGIAVLQVFVVQQYVDSNPLYKPVKNLMFLVFSCIHIIILLIDNIGRLKNISLEHAL